MSKAKNILISYISQKESLEEETKEYETIINFISNYINFMVQLSLLYLYTGGL